MAKVDLNRGAPPGVTLEVASRRHEIGLRDGFNSGLAAASTRWHLPRPLRAGPYDTQAVRRYAIVRDGRVIGTCRLWHPQFAGLELAIAIFDPGERGRGVGTYAVRTLRDVAFHEMKTHRLELGVYPDNLGAIRVYEKCGFRREALLRRYMHHDGRWRDVLWMAVLRSDAPPA
jgi:RimJ/RimL family protein N-acetyltransferase